MIQTVDSVFLSSLRAVDYNDDYLVDVPYGEISTYKEPENHKWELKESILKEGIRKPIVVMHRGLAFRLVDGHHRAKIALDEKLPCPAIIHQCDCSPYQLNFFNLCPIVNKITEEVNAAF